jgi:hypothetical protein
MENTGNAIVDFGRFMTGFLVVMGIGTCYTSLSPEKAHVMSQSMNTVQGPPRNRSKLTTLCTALPALLAHCTLIAYPAMIMSIIGGLLIYGTIISFTMFFQEEQEF